MYVKDENIETNFDSLILLSDNSKIDNIYQEKLITTKEVKEYHLYNIILELQKIFIEKYIINPASKDSMGRGGLQFTKIGDNSSNYKEIRFSMIKDENDKLRKDNWPEKMEDKIIFNNKKSSSIKIWENILSIYQPIIIEIIISFESNSNNYNWKIEEINRPKAGNS